MKITPNPRTWVEIDTNILINNISVLRSMLPDATKLMCVIKSNAYGHGLIGVARIIQKIGNIYLAVDSFGEAVSLRENKIKLPILVLGFVPEACFKECANKNIGITISSIKPLKSLLKFKNKKALSVSIKIDSGLHRQGFLWKDRNILFSYLDKLPEGVSISGLYSHCAVLDEKNGKKFTKGQVEIFTKWRDEFNKNGYFPGTHIFSSSGAFIKEKEKFDFVRCGIALYGHYPSDWIGNLASKNTLKPVLSWKTIVSETKKINKGESVGYGLTEKVTKYSTIAVCPVGYWQGYPRSLSRKGIVLINGKRAKVLGAISMDMMVVDITGIRNVKQGSKVTLIGKDKREEVSAEEVAKLAGTISYEILTRINPEIPRIYI